MAWAPLLVSHVAAAALAIPIGAYNLLRKPQGDPFHKALGYVWVSLIAWVVGTSFWIREITPGEFSWIHLLSILTAVTLTLGVVHARRRNMRAHRAKMRGTYVGLLGVGALAVPQRDIPSLARENPLGFVAIVALLLAMSAVVILGIRAIAQARPRRSGD